MPWIQARSTVANTGATPKVCTLVFSTDVTNSATWPTLSELEHNTKNNKRVAAQKARQYGCSNSTRQGISPRTHGTACQSNVGDLCGRSNAVPFRDSGLCCPSPFLRPAAPDRPITHTAAGRGGCQRRKRQRHMAGICRFSKGTWSRPSSSFRRSHGFKNSTTLFSVSAFPRRYSCTIGRTFAIR